MRTQSPKQSEEIKIAETIFLVIISYLITWLPLTLDFMIVIVSQNPQLMRSFNYTFGFIFHNTAVFATHFSVVIDPIIYIYRTKEIRDGIKKLLNLDIEDEATRHYKNQALPCTEFPHIK